MKNKTAKILFLLIVSLNSVSLLYSILFSTSIPGIHYRFRFINQTNESDIQSSVEQVTVNKILPSIPKDRTANFVIHLHNYSAIQKNVNISVLELIREVREIILGKPENNPIGSAPSNEMLADKCRIPSVDVWPKGILFDKWPALNCGTPDPVYVRNGKVFITDNELACTAILHGIIY